MTKTRYSELDTAPAAAGGGLLHRRHFLELGGGAVAGLAGAAALTGAPAGAAVIGDSQPEWMTTPGEPFLGYGRPSPHEAKVAREIFLPWGETAPGSGVSFTPLHQLTGTITPNGLHFERHHAGVPQIDPDRHELLVHGLVERPLTFTVESLLRYPMVSRIYFIECSGNSFWNAFPTPKQASVGYIHGLISCSEWSGIPLSTLLDEAGVKPEAGWFLAEGADAAALSRSIPLDKAYDDAMVALYQNGERIRPEQGYPMRLLLPGWEGNSQVKWLRRLKLVAAPMETRQETSKYTDTMPDGQSRQFTFPMAAKSVITAPGPGLTMSGPGYYEISGLAWSGHGTIKRVEVSADGGVSWTDAALQGPGLAKALTRFRLPWRWDGAPARLVSRAYDEHGNTQPDRGAWAAQYKANIYHYNAMQIWEIKPDGEILNVYA